MASKKKPITTALQTKLQLNEMSNSSSSDTKYQTLTPVPPIPPLSNPANYASPQSSGHYPSTWSNNSYSNGPGYSSFVQSSQYTGQQAPHSIGYMPNSYGGDQNMGKQWKVGHGDSEPLTPEARTMENSFQVPSVSSTSTRPGPGQGPPHPQASPMNINHHSIHHSQQHHHHPPPPPPPPPHHLHHNLHHNVSSVPPHSTGASSSGSWEQNSSSSDKAMAQNNITGSQPPQPSSAQQSGPMIGNNIEVNANNGEKVTKKKRKRCGECQGCLKKDNCGECGPCKSVRSHQICKMRKCDQLKTKKEKSREAAQAAAAAAAAAASAQSGLSGINNTKDISGNSGLAKLDGNISRPNSVPRPGSSNINGSVSSPFLVASSDTSTHQANEHMSFGEFGSKHGANLNPMYNNGGDGAYNNYTPPQMPNSYNGHGMMAPNGLMSEDGSDITNRHQMMNSRLKSLIQSRQSNKGINNGAVSNTVYSSPGSQPSGPPSIYTGSNYNTAQASSNNSSMSPHFIKTSGLPSQRPSPRLSSENTFGQQQLNWASSECNSDQLSSTNSGDKTGRRTPFTSMDTSNRYNYNNNYSQFDRNNTPSDSTYEGAAHNSSQPVRPNNNGTGPQFLASYSTPATSNQSQQYSPLPSSSSPSSLMPQSHTSSSSSTSQEMPLFSNQSQSSAMISPARCKSVDSNGTRGNEIIMNGSGINRDSNSNDDSSNQSNSQPFLSNTTTSMNTYTNIISTYNTPATTSASTDFYNTSSDMPCSPLEDNYLLPLPPPGPTPSSHFGFFGSGNHQPVIMNNLGASESDDVSKSLSGMGHDMVIDCGRLMDQADSTTSSSGFGILTDLNSYSVNKSDPSSTFNFISSESQVTTESNTVLPPVSTFLLPNWWDRSKSYGSNYSNKMDTIDQSCESLDCVEDKTESEYNPTLTLASLTATSLSH